MHDYDLLVIGSGPGGQKAAIAGAKLGKRTAVIEKRHMVGGVCINTGTIPSKTLREAILYLTGLNQREMYGASYRLKNDITVADLSARTQHVIGREIERDPGPACPQPRRDAAGRGAVRRSAHRRRLGCRRQRTNGHRRPRIVLAVGTRPARPESVAFDGRTIVDSDQILQMDRIPSSMVVVGAGVIGIEYASMFAALGSKVTVVERRERMLDFCDLEIVEALKYQLRDLEVTFRFRETVDRVERHDSTTLTVLESGKRIPADMVMYSAGRQGVTDRLDLANAGLEADDRGRIKVDENFRTQVPHVYAVGDVIGFSGIGGDVDGTGSARRLPRIRRAGERPARRAAADRHLRHPGNQLRRQDRGRTHPGQHPVRGRYLPIPRARPWRDPR
jgi:NAD(P) transhydrogenase